MVNDKISLSAIMCHLCMRLLVLLIYFLPHGATDNAADRVGVVKPPSRAIPSHGVSGVATIECCYGDETKTSLSLHRPTLPRDLLLFTDSIAALVFPRLIFVPLGSFPLRQFFYLLPSYPSLLPPCIPESQLPVIDRL